MIKRYECQCNEEYEHFKPIIQADDGDFVLYSDHLATLKVAVKEKERQIQQINDYHTEQIAALTAEIEQWKLSRDGVMAEFERLTAERDNLLLHPADPASGWQGIKKEIKLWEAKCLAMTAEFAAYKAGNYDPAESIRLNGEVIRKTAENERLRGALTGLIPLVDKTIDYCDHNENCHDPDAECPILMGEFLEDADRKAVQIAQAALKGEKEAKDD